MTGGTIDRWTRTIYMIEPPGLRFHTRLEYALHECVHLFAHPHAPTQQALPATVHRRVSSRVRHGLR